MKEVKIQFDANQDYQLKAVDSVVNLFDGLSKEELGNEDKMFDFTGDDIDSDVTPNVDELFSLDYESLKEKFDNVRQANKLEVKPQMDDTNNGDTLSSTVTKSDFWEYPEFTINMETGTGKTYVYLRTIYRLCEKYGFRKFVVVVPSVAIYEGAIATFNSTKDHFGTLFPVEARATRIINYDGNVTVCKNFAQSTSLEIFLTTIDSFNKTSNVIYKATEKLRGGKLPIEFIQECRPILILDEVQNYQTDNARRALRTLHPLFSVGYSATPKNAVNELYRLTSYHASQMNLVKKIDVLGYQEGQISTTKADYFKIIQIKKDLSVEMELACLKNGSLVTNILTLKKGDSFSQKSKNEAYGNLSIENVSIKSDNTYVELNNGLRFCQDQASCASLSKEVIFRQMIRSTIECHIEQQNKLLERGYDAKVLSLFFIDKVSSYKGDLPIIANLFDEEFEKLKDREDKWKTLVGQDVREGYFAKKQKPKTNEFEDIDTAIDGKKTDEEKNAEKKAYELIMKGKERLLSNDEKVCFIFAHSALREGWDNPNVFQICALREITSESNRRQTIGRGLRLPVGQTGERIHDNDVNHLTVIANESYNRFVAKLQEEYIADGILEKPQITNKRQMEEVKRTKRFKSTEFEDIWRKANRKTDYTIHINTEELIKEAIEALDSQTFEPPKLIKTKGKIVITIYDLVLKGVLENGEALFNVTIRDNEHPDLFGETGSTFYLKKGDVVGKKTLELNKCPELAGLKVVSVNYNKNNPEHSSILFQKIENPLLVGEKITHQTTSGYSTSHEEIKDIEFPDIPKCNIIERASKEVKITRKTILKIFKGMKQKHQLEFMKNPEGVTSQFIAILKEVVANHIAKNIEYEQSDGNITNDIDVLFPKKEVYSSHELVEVKHQEKCIYEKIQYDSEVEKNFIYTLDDSDKTKGDVRLYFKFPPKYKINLPKIIGNYNPDWAIVRRNEQNIQVELIRETKGTEDLNNLWHSNESRKIVCAQKHFQSVGLEYKVIDDKDLTWWKPNTKNYAEEVFGEKTDTDENTLKIV